MLCRVENHSNAHTMRCWRRYGWRENACEEDTKKRNETRTFTRSLCPVLSLSVCLPLCFEFLSKIRRNIFIEQSDEAKKAKYKKRNETYDHEILNGIQYSVHLFMYRCALCNVYLIHIHHHMHFVHDRKRTVHSFVRRIYCFSVSARCDVGPLPELRSPKLISKQFWYDIYAADTVRDLFHHIHHIMCCVARPSIVYIATAHHISFDIWCWWWWSSVCM